MRQDLVLCKFYGWSWAQLMATPPEVVAEAVALLREAAQEGTGGPSREPVTEYP